MREHIRLIESMTIDYRVMAGDETAEYLRDHDSDLIRSGRIRYLNASELRKEIHVVALLGENIVGMAGLQINPYDTKQLWIKFISVDKNYQGLGVGKALLRHSYIFASHEGLKMAPGSFTDEGERLRHLHAVFDEEFPEVAYARNSRGDYIDGDRIIRRND